MEAPLSSVSLAAEKAASSALLASVVMFDMKGPTFRHKRYEDYKIHRAPIAALIAGRAAKPRLASYVNYLAGDTRAERLSRARACREAGCRRFKIFHNASQRELFECYDALAAICGAENIAVDAQWRLDPKTATG